MKWTLAGVLAFILSGMSLIAASPQPEIFPVKDVKPGMQGVAYSVFSGTEPESFPVEVMGVLKNSWGPRQDIILVKVGGRFEKTGVAAGMSGSPVYIDGKWLGAISLRIGVFPTEPIAGVTPAELMTEIKETDRSEPMSVAYSAPRPSEGKGANTDSSPVMAAMADLLPPALRAPASQGDYLTPIETPLIFSGFSRPVLDFFSPLFQRMGVVAVQGGADPDATEMASPEELKKALPPGSAVSGMLVTGDLALAGTGTVTYNDGTRVLAFGHPFFGLGPVDMPMTKAEVITTFGSSFSPFKIANSTQVVGSIVQDRHSGIMGVLGKPAQMIPVTVTVNDHGKVNKYHYQMIQNPQWTPVVLTITLFNTLNQTNVVSGDTSFRVRGAAKINGYPDLQFNSLFATPGDSQLPPGLSVATWVSTKFNQIFQNRFERPDVAGIDLVVDLVPELRSAAIENVWSATSEVHPGDDVPVKIALRPFRGSRIIKETKVKIPQNAPRGTLRILFSDADTVSIQGQEKLPLQQNKVSGLRDMIDTLNRDRSNQEIYITVWQPTPAAFYDDKLLPSIPPTIANVMDSARAANRFTLTPETAIGRSSIPMDVVVSGGQSLIVNVN